MNFLWWILMGLIVGAIAKAIMKQPGGWLSSILYGLAGGFVGGWIGDLLFRGTPGFLMSLVLAVAGACLVIFGVRAVQSRR